jgi:hypothetical protein
VDDILRRNLIKALEARGWSYHAAERAAVFVSGNYQTGEGEWRVWPSGNAAGPDHYRVGRRESAVPVYDSPLEGHTRDVANALNELERSNSDATGTH